MAALFLIDIRFKCHRADYPLAHDQIGLILPYLQLYAVFIGLFYLNSAILFPRFYLRKHYVIYFSIFLLLLIGVVLLEPFDDLLSFHK